MKPKIAVIAIFAMSLLALNGCAMMAGMCGGMMGGDSHPRMRESPQSAGERIVKETIFGDYRLVAEFPPLQQHEETMLTLRIYSLNDSISTDAKVRLRIAEGKIAGKENVLFDDLLKPSEPGKYEHSFTPHNDGVYHLEFHVSLWDDQTLKDPLVLSATQEVKAMAKTHRSGLFRITPLKLVAGVLMGSMMLAMAIVGFC